MARPRYQPPCDACVADGLLRGAMCGTIWGLFGFSQKIEAIEDVAAKAAATTGTGKAGGGASGAAAAAAGGGAKHESSEAWLRRRAPRADRRVAALFKSNALVPRTLAGAAVFAGFMGVFSGVSCAVERGRVFGRAAWPAYCVGGVAAGMLVSPWGTTLRVRAGAALAFGAIAGAVTFFAGGPASHPPPARSLGRARGRQHDVGATARRRAQQLSQLDPFR